MTCQQEKNFQEQIQSHKEGLVGIIDLVTTNQWDTQEALELGIQPTELFHTRFIGGSKETCKMMDDLFSTIIKAKKVCLEIS